MHEAHTGFLIYKPTNIYIYIIFPNKIFKSGLSVIVFLRVLPCTHTKSHAPGAEIDSGRPLEIQLFYVYVFQRAGNRTRALLSVRISQRTCAVNTYRIQHVLL